MVNGCAQLPGYRRLKVLLTPVLLIMLGIVGGGLLATLHGTSSYKDRLPLLLRPGPVSPQRRHNASVVRSLTIGAWSLLLDYVVVNIKIESATVQLCVVKDQCVDTIHHQNTLPQYMVSPAT